MSKKGFWIFIIIFSLALTILKAYSVDAVCCVSPEFPILGCYQLSAEECSAGYIPDPQGRDCYNIPGCTIGCCCTDSYQSAFQDDPGRYVDQNEACSVALCSSPTVNCFSEQPWSPDYYGDGSNIDDARISHTGDCLDVCQVQVLLCQNTNCGSSNPENCWCKNAQTTSTNTWCCETASPYVYSSQSACQTACAPATNYLEGTVTNLNSGTAISGAHISTDRGPTATTNSAGYYRIDNLAAGSITVTASATGYVQQTKTGTIISPKLTLNFQLTPSAVSELCTDRVDNDGDFLTDCQDQDCNGKTGPDGQICEYPREISCSDNFDNDGDNRIDSLDLDCACVCGNWVEAGCGGQGTSVSCSGTTMLQTRTCTPSNCQQQERCVSSPNCVCSPSSTRPCPLQQGVCANTIEICTNNQWPGCDYSAVPGYQTAESNCNDGLDNDCDGLADCTDTNCAGALPCSPQCSPNDCSAAISSPCLCGSTQISSGYCCSETGTFYPSQEQCSNLQTTPNTCVIACSSGPVDSATNGQGFAQCVCEANIIDFNAEQNDYCCPTGDYIQDISVSSCPIVPTYKITGFVLDSLSRSPISRAVVSTNKGDSGTTDLAGAFSITIDQGSGYRLFAAADNYKTYSSPALFDVSGDLFVGDILLEKIPLWSLGGKVADENLKDLPYGLFKVSVLGTSFVYENGRNPYRIDSIPEGMYDVEVSATGYISQKKTVSLAGGNNLDFNFALRKESCTSALTTNPPILGDATAVFLKPELSFSWQNTCSNAIKFGILRCSGTNCIPSVEEYSLPSMPMEFIDDNHGEGLLPETDYCYKVRAVYNGFTVDSGIKCRKTGVQQCINAPESAPSTYQYCEANARYRCSSDNNEILLQTCVSGTTCIGPDSSYKTYCVAGDECERCSKPLGMFSIPEKSITYTDLVPVTELCMNIPFCYYDYTNTTVDMYNECYRADTKIPGEFSCYDYKSKDACEQNKCVADTNCEWASHPLYGELGKGVCRPAAENEQNCGLCNSGNGIFEQCDTQQDCSLYGKCYLAEDGLCKGTELICGDYRNENECTGGQGVVVDVQWNNGNKISGTNIKNPESRDYLDLGVCKWGAPANIILPPGEQTCFKDADNHNDEDCPIDKNLCKDKTPPATSAFYLPRFKDGSVTFMVSDENPDKFYFCKYLQGEAECIYPNIELAQQNAEKTLFILGNAEFPNSGAYHVKFFAEDKSHNLEEVKSISFVVDKSLTVSIATAQIPVEIIPTVIKTDLTVQITFGGEKATCSGYLHKHDSDTHIQNANDLFKREFKNSFTINYKQLDDGVYLYEWSCDDEVANSRTGTEAIYVDADKTIYDLLPKGTIAAIPYRLELKTKSSGACTREDTGAAFTREQSADGTYYLHYYPVANELSSATRETKSYGVACTFLDMSAQDTILFTIDREPPATSITVAQDDTRLYDLTVWRQSATFSLFCSDPDILPAPGEFGCDKTYYCKTSEGVPCNPTTEVTGAITLNSEAQNTIYYFSADKGGNREAIKSQTFRIDTQMPAFAVTITNPDLTRNNAPVVTKGKVYYVELISSEPISRIENFYYQVTGGPQESITLTSADGISWNGIFIIPDLTIYTNKELTAQFFIRAYDQHGMGPLPDGNNEITAGELFLIDTKGPDKPALYLKSEVAGKYYIYASASEQPFNIPGSVLSSGQLLPNVQVLLDQNSGVTRVYTTTSKQLSVQLLPGIKTYGDENLQWKDIVLVQGSHPEMLQKYIEFSQYKRFDHRRYFVKNTQPKGSDTELLFLDKPLEQTIPHDTLISVYNEEFETGWFEFNVALEPGENEIIARAKDELGNTGEPIYPPWIIMYDPYAPLITVSPENIVTSSTSFPMIMVVTDDETGVVINSITLTIDAGSNNGHTGTYVCKQNTGSTYTKSLTCAVAGSTVTVTYDGLYTEGLYSLNLQAKDNAGNSASKDWWFRIDLGAPNCNLMAFNLVGGRRAGDGLWYTNPSGNIIADILFGETDRIEIISVLLDGAVQVPFEKLANNLFKLTISGLTADRVYDLDITAKKQNPITGLWHEGICDSDFVIDKFPPSIILNTATTNSYSMPVTARGTYSDTPTAGIDNIEQIKITGGSADVTITPVSGINKLTKRYTAEIPLDTFTEEDYPITLTATAYDKAWNIGSATAQVIYDGIAPTLNVQLSVPDKKIYCSNQALGLAQDSCITSSAVISVTGNLDEYGFVTITVNGEVVGSEIETGSNNDFSLTGIYLTEQQNTVTVNARDSAGNIALPVTKTITLDQNLPVINFIEPPDTVYLHYTPVPDPLLKVQTDKFAKCEITPAITSPAKYNMDLVDGNNNQIILDNVLYALQHTYRFTIPIGPSTQAFTVACTDYLGITKTAQFAFTYDNSIPNIATKCMFSNNEQCSVPTYSEQDGTIMASYEITRYDPVTGALQARLVAYDTETNQDEIACSYSCSLNSDPQGNCNILPSESQNFATETPFSLEQSQTITFNNMGLHTFTITCRDRAGNSDIKYLGIDVLISPQLIITKNLPKDITNANPVILEIETNNWATCTYRKKPLLFGSWIPFPAATSTGILHRVSLGGLAEGNYVYQTRCIDTANNEEQLDIPFTVDRTLPVVSNIAVSPSECSTTGGECIVFLTGSENPTITGTANEILGAVSLDVAGPAGIKSYDAVINQNAFTSLVNLNSFGQDYSIHNVDIKATDAATNPTTKRITIQLDKKGPERVVVSALPNPTSNGRVTVSGNVYLTGTQPEKNAIVNIYINGILTFKATADANGHYTQLITRNLMPNELNIIKAEAFDRFGNGPVSISTSVYYINMAPELVSITPADGSTTNPGCRPVDKVSAIITERDNAGVYEAISGITVFDSSGNQILGASSFAQSANSGCTGECIELIFTPDNPFGNGAYVINIRANDNLGNSDTYTKNFAISSDAPCLSELTVQPVGECTVTPDRPYYTNCNAVLVSGNVLTQTEVSVSFKVDGVEIGPWSFAAGSAGDFSQTIQIGADKKYSVIATATDILGNAAVDTFEITRDTINPQVGIDIPSEGYTTNKEATAEFGGIFGSWQDANKKKLEIYNNRLTPALVNTINPIKKFGQENYFQNVGLVSGLNTITTTAYDIVGNSASDSVGITLDTTRPSITEITSVIPGIEAQSVVIEGTTYQKFKTKSQTVTVTGIYSDEGDIAYIKYGTNTAELTFIVGGAIEDTLEEGATKTYVIDGKEYTVRVLAITDVAPIVAKFQVNGEITKSLSEGSSHTLSDGTEIGVIDIIPNEAGDVSLDMVNFYLRTKTKIFSITIDNLQPNENPIVLDLADKAGNKNTYGFFIDLDIKPPQITSFIPVTNVSGRGDLDAVTKPAMRITTDEWAKCSIKYQTSSGDFYDTLDYVPDALHTTHTVTLRYMLPYDELSLQKQKTNIPIKITCSDQFENQGITNMRFTTDLKDPIINDFKLIGNDAIFDSWQGGIKQFYLVGNLLTAVSAETDEFARCKYTMVSALQTKIPAYDELATKFLNFEGWSTRPVSDTLSNIQDKNTYYIYLACEDKATRISGTKIIKMIVNTDLPIQITELNPQNSGFTKNLKPVISLKTNRPSICTIDSGQSDAYVYESTGKYSTGRVPMQSTDRLYHTAQVSGSSTALTNLAEKGYNFDISCTALNVPLNPASVTLLFTVDATVPILTIESPQDGFTASAPTMDFVVHTEDLNPGTVQFYVNGKTQMPPAPINSNSITITKNIALAPGQNEVRVEAKDRADNTNSQSIKGFFDNKGPTVEIISPSNHGPFRSVDRIIAELKESNLGGGVDLDKSKIVLTNLNNEELPMAKNTYFDRIRGRYVLDYSIAGGLKEGRYLFTVYSFNLAGTPGEVKKSWFDISFSVPVVTFTEPTLGAIVSSSNIRFAGQIDTSGQSLTQADLVLNGQVIANLLNYASGNQFSVNLADLRLRLKEGYNEYYVILKTEAGNSGESPSRYLYLDTLGPIPVSVVVGGVPIFGRLVPPSCDDGIKNQDETDIDCGGDCQPCGIGEGCIENTDCASNLCVNSLCTSETPKPDLVVERVTITPANPKLNQDVTFSAVIKNQGSATTTTTFNVRLLVSATVPRDLSASVITRIAQGSEFTVAFNPVKLSLGANKINVIADSTNRVAELNENNNDMAGREDIIYIFE